MLGPHNPYTNVRDLYLHLGDVRAHLLGRDATARVGVHPLEGLLEALHLAEGDMTVGVWRRRYGGGCFGGGEVGGGGDGRGHGGGGFGFGFGFGFGYVGVGVLGVRAGAWGLGLD